MTSMPTAKKPTKSMTPIHPVQSLAYAFPTVLVVHHVTDLISDHDTACQKSFCTIDWSDQSVYGHSRKTCQRRH